MERLSILYATALFELALSKGLADEFLRQAILIRDSLQSAEFQRILLHPHISAEEKRLLFENAFGGNIHEDLRGFFFLVTEKNREAYLLTGLKALIDMIERHQHKTTAIILSATPLSEKQAALMKKMLSSKLNKTVKLSMKVDPSVIGGPHIYVDGFYIDWTVKKRLRDLTIHMKEGCSA